MAPASTRLNHLLLSSLCVYVCIFVGFEIKTHYAQSTPRNCLLIHIAACQYITDSHSEELASGKVTYSSPARQWTFGYTTTEMI